jgi:hypothetical protein
VTREGAVEALLYAYGRDALERYAWLSDDTAALVRRAVRVLRCIARTPPAGPGASATVDCPAVLELFPSPVLAFYLAARRG